MYTFCDALQLHRKPLVTSELIGPLCKIDPIYKEEEEAFKVCVVWLLHVCILLNLCLSLALAGDRQLAVCHWTPCRSGMRRPPWERREMRLPKEAMKMMGRRARTIRKERRKNNELHLNIVKYNIRTYVYVARSVQEPRYLEFAVYMSKLSVR